MHLFFRRLALFMGCVLLPFSTLQAASLTVPFSEAPVKAVIEGFAEQYPGVRIEVFIDAPFPPAFINGSRCTESRYYHVVVADFLTRWTKPVCWPLCQMKLCRPNGSLLILSGWAIKWPWSVIPAAASCITAIIWPNIAAAAHHLAAAGVPALHGARDDELALPVRHHPHDGRERAAAIWLAAGLGPADAAGRQPVGHHGAQLQGERRHQPGSGGGRPGDRQLRPQQPGPLRSRRLQHHARLGDPADLPGVARHSTQPASAALFIQYLLSDRAAIIATPGMAKATLSQPRLARQTRYVTDKALLYRRAGLLKALFEQTITQQLPRLKMTWQGSTV